MLTLFSLFVLSVPAAAAPPSTAGTGGWTELAAQSGAAAAAIPGDEVVVVKAGGLSAASLFTGTGAVVHAAAGGRFIASMPAGEVASFLTRTNDRVGVSYAEVSSQVHEAALPANRCIQGCGSNSNPPTSIVVGDSDDADGLPCGFAGDCQPADGIYSQSYLNQIDVPQAWAVTHGSPSIKVAVLDTGVDNSAPDLQNVQAYEPALCTDESYCTTGANVDQVGHGSHVSGVIGADNNLNMGTAGIGWNVQTEMFKVLNGQGEGSDADVVSGIYAAVASGARVISMSLTGGLCTEQCIDPDEAAAVSYAIAHNVVVVAAAGNDSSNSPEYPASLPGVLSVAATDDGSLAWFSEYGAAANIAAPGVNILSTFNNDGYALMSGTSMATPMVAAAAALVLSVNPKLTPLEVDAILEQTATPIAGNPISGGQVDVAAAVAAARQTAPRAVNGYQIAGSNGSVYTFGSALNYGSVVGKLNRPVVGIAVIPGGGGYWLDASDGGVFSFGAASFRGSMGGQHLNQPIVGMASTPDGKGYWLVASDGGIFSFGDAHFYGSTGSIKLNKPIVGMALSPNGAGYWLVASDGGIFTFGAAPFLGSAGAIPLNKPIVAMVPTPVRPGYWLVASDGGVFTYGAATFWGSTGGDPIPAAVTGAGSGG